MKQEFKYLHVQWHGQPKMTRHSKNLEGPCPPAPLATPMYVRFIEHICNVNTLCKQLHWVFIQHRDHIFHM